METLGSPLSRGSLMHLLPTIRRTTIRCLGKLPRWCSPGRRNEWSMGDLDPFAPSNRHPNLSTSYRKHENEKKRAYEQRILNIEHSSFSPIVMSCTGGLGRIATNTYKRLASMLAEKWNQAYSPTMCWLRCRLSFSLLRSSIQSIRGSRSSSGRAIHPAPPIDQLIN